MGNRLAKVVGIASQAKEAIAANTTDPAARLKVGPHAFQTQQVFFPFWSIHASRMPGVRVGLQRSLVRKCSARYVLIEGCSTLIQPGPQVSMRRVGLLQQCLGGHRMVVRNHGMIGWAADAT